MRPSKTLLNITLIWLASALILFAVRLSLSESVFAVGANSRASYDVSIFEHLWLMASLGFFIVAGFDLLRFKFAKRIIVRRTLPHSLALGVHAEVELLIENEHAFPIEIWALDKLPDNVSAEALPIQTEIRARSSRTLRYQILPIERGEASFGDTLIRVATRWKMWQRLVRIPHQETVKIYPNFAPIANATSIGLEQQIAQLGVHLQQRRGEGSDFHQLRDFREGDSLRQIDWNATARHRKPISRDYQDERDQDIVFLLDCGRRLRNKDDQISHFDHALNALLITSYIALRQGDAVGLMSFAGDQRWQSPVKNPANINVLLNQLYDLYTSTQTSDYLQAAQDFIARANKRSLVILITNVHEEDMEDLLAAAQLLRKKHIVMIASLRDLFWSELKTHEPQHFNEALRYCGLIAHTQQRQTLLSRLQNLGCIMTDSKPNTLHIDLVNEYMRLKRSGRL